MSKLRIPYDRSWKEIVTYLTQPFVAFFLPDLNQHVDWTFPPEFLEKELFDSKQSTLTKRELDKLVKVRLKNGEEKWIFIHIEFQTLHQGNIGYRMYEYYRLIRDQYGKKIVAIVVYTGRYVPKMHNMYREVHFETELIYKFHSYAIINQSEAELLDSDNPFAIVVLANWYVLHSQRDYKKRYDWKARLFELASQRGYSATDYENLLIFVSELMKLPPDLKQRFEQEVIKTKVHNKNDMIKVGQDTKDLINAFTEAVYGEKIDQLKQANKEERKMREREQKMREQAAKKAEREQKMREREQKMREQVEATSVVLLFSKANMSVPEIAVHLHLDDVHVRRVLSEHGLL